MMGSAKKLQIGVSKTFEITVCFNIKISSHQIFSKQPPRGQDFADRWPSGNMRAEYTPGQYHIYLKEPSRGGAPQRGAKAKVTRDFWGYRYLSLALPGANFWNQQGL